LPTVACLKLLVKGSLRGMIVATQKKRLGGLCENVGERHICGGGTFEARTRGKVGCADVVVKKNGLQFGAKCHIPKSGVLDQPKKMFRRTQSGRDVGGETSSTPPVKK